jgi:uncharacterized protein (TIGR00288 family)
LAAELYKTCTVIFNIADAPMQAIIHHPHERLSHDIGAVPVKEPRRADGMRPAAGQRFPLERPSTAVHHRLMKQHNDNIALLIDSDNASHNGIDPVLTALAELGTVNIRRAYGNWTKAALKGWERILHKYGIEPQQQFDMTKGKNATDMKMTIDAMDLLFRGNVTGFGIMSSDSDFMPLAMRIRQEGLPVYGFGSAKTPEAFKQACSRFIDVDALIEVDKRNRGGTKSDVKTAARAEAPGGASDSSGKVDDELLNLLIDAYQATKRDAEGYASLSEVGKIAGNRSSFDVRNYGFARLSEMFESVPNFQTRRDEHGHLFVKRLR